MKLKYVKLRYRLNIWQTSVTNGTLQSQTIALKTARMYDNGTLELALQVKSKAAKISPFITC